MEGTNTTRRLKGTCGDLEMVMEVVGDGVLSLFFLRPPTCCTPSPTAVIGWLRNCLSPYSAPSEAPPLARAHQQPLFTRITDGQPWKRERLQERRRENVEEREKDLERSEPG